VRSTGSALAFLLDTTSLTQGASYRAPEKGIERARHLHTMKRMKKQQA
jgi:hypothetical protein